MNFQTRDFIKLVWHAIAALAMIAASGLVVFWSATAERQASARRDAAASARTQIEQRLRQVRTEEQEIKARTLQYQGMEERGMTGTERRLEWTELLRDLNAQIGLPGISYELGAQAQLEPAAAGSPAYHVSTMKLQLHLLHEEDLLNFLTRLRQQASALTLVRSCRVARAGSAAPAPAGAQLTADCQIDWITLRKASVETRP
ncbi:MAG: hypothetical protein FIB06_06055 [Betaproteobacteria bacterium]|nr:hypothetical protein [Betaproteobacteria bacterium]